MASIKDSNGQFKTLQLGTNRPVAFKQFFAAASAAGYDMRSVAKEQGVDPEVKLNREQRRKLEKENRHMSNKAKNRKQSERLPESEMSGREAQKQPSAPQEPETLCVLEHGRLTRHQTSHGRFLFTYAPADGSDEVVKSVRGRRSEIVASFNEWYAEKEKVTAVKELQLVNAIVDEDRQYATRLTITRTDNENASESVISTVISWLMKKKVLSKEYCDSFRDGAYSTPDGWKGTTELEQGKTALASKRNSGVPGCVVWEMELDEQDHRLIYGRWHTRIGIIGNADSCIVNIQLSRYIVRGFIGEAAPPIPSTPRIVKMLFSDEANVVRVGSTFLNDKPIYLTSETLTSKFIPDLTDPDRTLSLILITTDEESKLPVRNLKNLTKQLFGMADIYVLDWHDRALMDTYREVFLKNTPAYDYGMECSSLKIYCKPVDLTVPTDNEMGMAYAKYLIDRYTRHGENRFINVLRQGICRASDRVAGDILSIADVRWLDGIDEAKRLSSRIKKLKQRVKGDSGGNETVDSLRDEISGLQKDIADWEEIASELETSNSEAAAKIDMLTRDAMRLENEKRAVERKLEMAELEQLNANALNGIRKALTVVPENLTQLLDLAKVLYPDRIVILPDAYRSAKKFDGILTEEWEILVAVATTLWDLCFKETVNDRLGSEFKKRTGYELARGESGTTCAMPNLMKLRKRMYNGKEIDISPHIKGRNIKAAFRLHFYIDRDEEKIVIGHAGEHMDTAGTPRR